MSTPTAIRHRPRQLAYALAVTPLLRWLIAHHSVPADQPWRTRCPVCATALWPAACTPSGQCRACQARVGAPPYAVELVAVAAFGLLAASGTRGWELAAYTWWSLGLLVLAFVDAAVLRLPHRLTLATTAGTVLLLMPVTASASAWWSAIIGAACLAGFYALIHAAARGGLGLGDVAVAVPIGIGVGWLDWRLIAVAAVLGHSLAAATIPIRRVTGTAPSPVPLGTYLIAGSLLIVVAAGVL